MWNGRVGRQGSGEDAVAPGCESSDAVEKKKEKVRPARFQRLVVNAATPDASKPVKKKGQQIRGEVTADGTGDLLVAGLMSFSLVAEGRLMRSTAPANRPAKARQSRLMSLPTQINASATTLRVSHLIWRRVGEELSDPLVHFMMYVNEQGGRN